MLTLADQLAGYQAAARRSAAERCTRNAKPTKGRAKRRDRAREHAEFCADVDRRILAAVSRIRRGTRVQIIAEASITKSVGYERLQHLVDARKLRVVGSCRTVQILGMA